MLRGALAGLFLVSFVSAQTAKDLYLAHCAACHGPRGEGGRGVNLTNLQRATDNDSLFGIIRKGIAGTEMPAAPLGDGEIRELVTFVRSLQGKPGDSYHVSQNAGNTVAVPRGEQVYRNAGCAKCHMAGDDSGGTLGPDLSRIGARRTREYLRRALLDPEADIPDNFGQYRWVTVIPDNFLQVRVVAKDGSQLTGARINEDTFSIQVRDAYGRAHSFWKDDLKELHLDWGKSPMPSFRGKLSDSDIDELVSWLSTLRGAR